MRCPLWHLGRSDRMWATACSDFQSGLPHRSHSFSLPAREAQWEEKRCMPSPLLPTASFGWRLGSREMRTKKVNRGKLACLLKWPLCSALPHLVWKALVLGLLIFREGRSSFATGPSPVSSREAVLGRGGGGSTEWKRLLLGQSLHRILHEGHPFIQKT